MSFMTPEKYSKTQESHVVINTSAVNEFVEIYGALTGTDKVLDFGAGTGETTVAIAQGGLGNLGRPGMLVGSDMSPEMVKYCQENYNVDNLTFEKLDVTKGEIFAHENSGSFSLVTSFSCLHWVTDHVTTAQLVNKVLKPGGRFLFMVIGGQNKEKTPELRIFDEMKNEDQWTECLQNVNWKTLNTKHVNSSWSASIDDQGYGPLTAPDYRRLMESQGFRVDLAKPIPLHYRLTKDFMMNMLQTCVYDALSTHLSEDNKETFLKEYKQRVEMEYRPDPDDLYDWHGDGFLIFGEKLSEIENEK